MNSILYKDSFIKPIILFDGVCLMCNSLVKRFIRFEKEQVVVFAHLQDQVVKDFELEIRKTFESTVYIIDGQYYEALEAVYQSRHHLKRPWSFLFSLLYIIPKPLKRVVYNFIASNRYAWFGKKEQCDIIPEINLRYYSSSEK